MHGRRPAPRTHARGAALAAATAVALAGATGAGATAAAAGSPTYRDVRPILLAKCASCHVQGGIAPFPLTTAKDAATRAALIAAVVRTGAMPPWLPGKDSPAFVGQERRILTAQEQRTIRQWVEGGAKR